MKGEKKSKCISKKNLIILKNVLKTKFFFTYSSILTKIIAKFYYVSKSKILFTSIYFFIKSYFFEIVLLDMISFTKEAVNKKMTTMREKLLFRQYQSQGPKHSP